MRLASAATAEIHARNGRRTGSFADNARSLDSAVSWAAVATGAAAAASLPVGAFVASLAATLGGRRRDAATSRPFTLTEVAMRSLLLLFSASPSRSSF